MDHSILDSLLSGDFKTFKEEITSALYSKIGARLEDASAEVANYTFQEESSELDESVEYLEENKKHVETAYNWHGGQWSPLYSFASTGGKVWSEDHRQGLKHEIADNINHLQKMTPEEAKYHKKEFKSHPDKEIKSLNSLLNHINSSKLHESAEDVKYKERVNHSDKDGYPEGKKGGSSDDEKGGEFLVNLTFTDGNNTKLENFRVVGTSKADIASRLDNFFGKGKFVVDDIKLSESRIDEVKKTTLQSYAKKSLKQIDSAYNVQKYQGLGRPGGTTEEDDKIINAATKKAMKRGKGIDKANYKLDTGDYQNEAVETVDEQRFEKGEDIGKPGFGFKKIAKKAAAEYGSEEAGKRVAGAVLKKILAKKKKK